MKIIFLQTGKFEENLPPPMDMNAYLDVILEAILSGVGQRNVVLTSFHPDICTMYVCLFIKSFSFKFVIVSILCFLSVLISDPIHLILDFLFRLGEVFT